MAGRLLTWSAILLWAATPAVAISPFGIALRQALRDQGNEPPVGVGAARAAKWQEYNLSVPIDHFHNDSIYEPHVDEHFNLRYWFDASSYKPGGPVIVLAAGETDAAERIPFLEHGIVSILTKATDGLGVILEHRYYGSSFPGSDPLPSPEDMRFLSTEQALADTAYFAKHVKFHGLEDAGLNPPDTPWIIYGGSYAGAFAAFARKLYPEQYWGAISSSGVTAAIFDYWEYFEAARLFSPGDCASHHQNIFKIVDAVLLSGDRDRITDFKNLFRLGELDDQSFASFLSEPISLLQNTNWDPELDAYEFGAYCGAISSNALLYGSTRHLVPTVKKVVTEAGFDEDSDVTFNLLNFIGLTKASVIENLKGFCSSTPLKTCLSRRYQIETLWTRISSVRSWGYQTCTQWGYFPSGNNVPEEIQPMISRVITTDFESMHCPMLFNITAKPEIVDSINKLGGFNFSYPRVAIVDGTRDPWRQATPHKLGLPERKSTTEEPFILLDYGVHHWDENGLKAEPSEPGLPPAAVEETQKEEAAFVKAWLKEFAEQKQSSQIYEGSLEL
ncbi:serine carboxypeptidase S28-domain-containing protein [Stachybotrys elegans]|uniref:Serine carboxypeptidase S28-domain-containing protein n=1 Tax=Stachybotrys elegans TaxID=80388 RepID=A0A8K0WUX7_9HYPO|nr:serine carboxypeptidase S28-domain-containing protein [Stachybotrys elegans]